MSTNELPFHVRLLADEFKRKQDINPRYSLRAFATFVSLHPSALSRILRGQQELSVKSCIEVAEKLKLNQEQKRQFAESAANEKRDRVLNSLKEAFGLNESTTDEVSKSRELVDLLVEPAWMFGTSSSVLYSNRAFEIAFGANVEGTSWTDLVASDDLASVEGAMSQLKESKRTVEFQCKVLTTQSVPQKYSVRLLPVRGASCEVLHWIGIATLTGLTSAQTQSS